MTGDVPLGVITDLPLVLTVDEAAELLRADRKTIYDGIHRGDLPHIRLGRLIRIPRHKFMEFIEATATEKEAHDE